MADFPRRADVVVVGGGVFGASIAYHLARRQVGEVVLVEARSVASGPTGRSTALVRRFYPTEFLTRTANSSANTFVNWKDEVGGDPGFHAVGYLVLADVSSASGLRTNVERAQRDGVDVTLIGPDEVRELTPEMHVGDIALASYEKDSGYADPSSTVSALVNAGRALGLRVVQYTPVSAVSTAGSRVTGVATQGDFIEAPCVVCAAGPWSNVLMAPLGIDVRIVPKRFQMSFFVRPAEFPEHPAVSDFINRTYMRPDHGNLTIFGSDHYNEPADPDSFNEGIDPGEIGRNSDLIVKRFPIMAGGFARGGYSGIYDMTDDRQPILGRISEYEGLFACYGWSGHGFKHAPAIGAILAELIDTGSSPTWDLSPFRWTRFREGEPLGSPMQVAHADGR